MVVLGIDAHKRTHTVVAVDSNGRQLAVRTFGTATADHLALLRWADQFDAASSGGGRSMTADTCHAVSNVTCPQRVNASPGCRLS